MTKESSDQLQSTMSKWAEVQTRPTDSSKLSNTLIRTVWYAQQTGNQEAKQSSQIKLKCQSTSALNSFDSNNQNQSSCISYLKYPYLWHQFNSFFKNQQLSIMQKQQPSPWSDQNNQHYKSTYNNRDIKQKLKSLADEGKVNKARNRLKSKNNKNSKEGRSSRSRSSSSYCEAGCLRRSTVKAQLKKSSINCKKEQMKSNQSKTKLFNAIQKFYTNLSSMPLDLLITHTNSQSWLKQQHETCQHLQQKLNKIHTKPSQKQNRNTLNSKQQSEDKKLKQQNYQYYVRKLEAVAGVLTNIQNNIGMLGSLYQQQLRNYTSNSSLSSCTNSKQSSNHKNSNQYLMDNSPTSTITQRQQPIIIQALNGRKQSKQVRKVAAEKVSPPVISNKQYKKQQSMYEIKDMDTNGYTYGTVHDSNCSDDGDSRSRSKDNINNNNNDEVGGQNNHNNSTDIYDKMLIKFNQNLTKLISSTSRNNKKQPTTHTTSIQPQWNQNMAQFLSTCRSQESPHHSPKMQSEQKSSIKNSQERTKRISGVTHGTEFQSISDLLALSLVNCAQSGSAHDVEQMKTMFKKLTNTWKISTNQKNTHQTAKQQTTRSFKSTKNYEHYTAPSVPLQNIKPLLTEITELKQELNEKNKEIENLLSNQQQLQSIIELYKKNDKEAKENNIYAGERIKNLENIVNKYERQIVKYQNIDVEMRESLRSQVSFVNSLQKQKEMMERKLKDETEVVEKLKRQIDHMKKYFNQEIEKLRKSQSIALEKMDIYKQKYYQIVHEGELKKIVLNSTYEGKAGKVKEIWGILNEHRKNLHALDQDQEKQNSSYRKSKRNKNKNRTTSQNSSQQSQPQYSSLSIPIKSAASQKNPKNILQKYKSLFNKLQHSP